MKTKFKARELLLLCLPVVLLAGIAWWLSSGGRVNSPLPNITRAIADARRPALSLEKVEARWISPTQGAFMSWEKGCRVTAFVPASAFLGQHRPAQVPTFITTDIRDDKGRSITAILGKKRVSSTAVYNGIPTSTSWNQSNASITGGTSSPPNATYEVSANIPFLYLPRGARSATFSGMVGWGSAKPVLVKFEILPSWMRRAATRLRVESVKWRPYPSNKGSDVDVVCRITKPVNAYVFGLSDKGTFHPECLGIGYDPKEFRWAKASGKDDIILGEWSQRIENGNGRLNSIDLLRDHMDKAMSQGHGGYFEPIAESLQPLCKVSYANVQGDKVRLTYSINGIPNTFKNPVFLCEIYLIGDGVVRVRCPLTKTAP